MINAKLHKVGDRYSLNVTGHAGRSSDGGDVCSAASALLCTLLDNLATLEDDRKIENLYSTLSSGSGCLEFDVAEGGFFDGETTVCDSIALGISESEILLFAFLRGFELLSDKYPESVSVDFSDVL